MTGYVNLRGEPIEFANEAFRKRIADRRALYPARRQTRPNGYAAPPGAGPEGETCASCRFKHSMASRSGKKHWIKCDANQPAWTNGRGSDILARSPACIRWEEPDPC